MTSPYALTVCKPTPYSFALDLDVPLTPFFAAWASDVGDASVEAKKIIDAKVLVKSRFARGRISSMLKLTKNQFEQVLVDVGADPSWRSVVEEYLDHEFVCCNAPPPSVTTLLQRLPQMVGITDGKEVYRSVKSDLGKMVTVSRDLTEREIKETAIPDNIFINITTPNLLVNPITDPEMSLTTTAVALWVFAKYGKLNIGAKLRRWLVLQLDHRVGKLPSFGNPPKLRTWATGLSAKLYNFDRPDARVQTTHACHTTANYTPLSYLVFNTTGKAVCTRHRHPKS